MKPLDPDKLAEAMIGGAKRYVDAALAPLLARLAEAEKRAADAEASIASMVSKAVSALPAPKDGRSVTVGELVPVIEERLAALIPAAVRAIPVPKDGVGVAGAMIDRKGCLVLTLSDGTTKELGRVVGRTVSREDIAALVGEAVAALPKPKDGESVDPEAVALMVRDEITKARILDLVKEAVGALPAPAPGKDAEPTAVAEIVRDMIADDLAEVTRAINAIPAVPELPDIPAMIEGAVEKSTQPIRESVSEALATVTPDAIAKAASDAAIGENRLSVMVAEAVAKLPPAEPGKSVPPEQVRPMLAELVGDAVKALPAPKDGHSPTAEELAPLIAEQVSVAVSEAVKGIPVPDAPLGYAKGLIDRDGHLVFTRSDGSTEDVGMIVGRDADMDAIKAEIERLVSEIPTPKDGLGFDDLAVEYDGERGINLRFEKGDVVREFPITMPIVIDRGVWQERGIEGAGYKTGDGVSWGGSFYIARKDTFAKPDDYESWRLSVKRGRDAKEPGNLK